MTSTNVHILCTPRDTEILHVLALGPLATDQLLKASQSFEQPFTADRPLRRRMQALTAAGWVRCWQYASTSRGAVNYYKLTPAGYRFLLGPKALLPSNRFFRPVSLGLQHHTRALADFIVHTVVSAHRRGVRLQNVYPENALRLRLGEETAFPDAAFELVTPCKQQFNFLVELDNGTERVRSQKDTESIERKVRFYDRLQTHNSRRRFRVIFLTTRSPERLGHILDAAADLVRDRHRSLVYAAHLADYVRQPDALCTRCFRDTRRQRVSLLPAQTVKALPANFAAQFIQPTASL